MNVVEHKKKQEMEIFKIKVEYLVTFHDNSTK